MNLLSLPWVEFAVLLPLFGALVVRSVRQPRIAHTVALSCTVGAFASALIAWVAFSAQITPNVRLFAALRVDTLSAPLFTLIALLHMLTVLTTARVKMNRISFASHLIGESIRLATFACLEPWPLILLLSLSVIPPLLEMRSRGKPTRLFALHMAIFIVLLVTGWLATEQKFGIGPLLLMLAVLVRSGAFPANLWVADLFENATFGTALLFVTPITGMYIALRLVLPIAPEWVLSSIVIFSVITAILSAAIAMVQTEARRFFAYIFLSQASLVLLGVEIHSELSLIGSLVMWYSVALSLGGLGLVLRSLEARFGQLTFVQYRGLSSTSPLLAVGFALFGLGSVGFPGTIGFIASEILFDAVIESNLIVGLAMVLVAALNGIAVVRVYLLIFTGTVRQPSQALATTPAERIAIVGLILLTLVCGLLPQLILNCIRTEGSFVP
jgi:NADH-quinone oxidoreductase subunit M